MPAYSGLPRLFVPESRLGFWFLGTQTWESRVIRVALDDLSRLIPRGGRPYRPVLLDVGCGQGKSFKPLHEHFAPQRLIGIDFEQACLEKAVQQAAKDGVQADVERTSERLQKEYGQEWLMRERERLREELSFAYGCC